MRILKATIQEKTEALRSNIYFDHLEAQVMEQMDDSITLHEYERGEIIFLENDPCHGLYIIRSGCVKIYRVSPQGRQYIVRLAQEGDTFNEVPVFDGKGNPVNAEAIEKTIIWAIDPQKIRTLIGSSPDFAGKVIHNLGQNLRMLVKTASEMAFYQVTHRLARLISSLPVDDLDSGAPAHWTQEQLAARLGTVREVVARSLRELERTGAIHTHNRRITVADPRVLEQWTQGPWN